MKVCTFGDIDPFHFSIGKHSIVLFRFQLNPFSNDKCLESSKLKELPDNNFRFDENCIDFFKRVEKNVGKGEIACYEQFLLSPVFSKILYCRHIKTRACLGKG